MITLPPETEELARRVAERRGSTPEDVVRAGVEIEAQIAGVALEDAKPRKEIDLERVRDIIRNVSSAPLRDTRLLWRGIHVALLRPRQGLASHAHCPENGFGERRECLLPSIDSTHPRCELSIGCPSGPDRGS
jgi:hypothetical protein